MSVATKSGPKSRAARIRKALNGSPHGPRAAYAVFIGELEYGETAEPGEWPENLSDVEKYCEYDSEAEALAEVRRINKVARDIYEFTSIDHQPFAFLAVIPGE